MPKEKLTHRFVTTTTQEGKHADGGGLYLLIRKRGDTLERLWLYRYRRGPRGHVVEETMSLGPLRDVSLAQAREKAASARAALAAGKDPRQQETRQEATTFGAYADAMVEDIEGGFRNPKHRAQWRMTLGDAYCASLRPLPLDAITTEHVLAVLKPVWLTKSETASRVRGRIERVLDATKANGLRTGDNPARWRGHLDKLLPKRRKLTRGHQKALHYNDVPEFMADLRKLNSVSAAALEFTILCAARTGETLGAKWPEIDFKERLWIIPRERMKAAREHRVPLCDRCIEILRELQQLSGDWVFPSQRCKSPLSNMAMLEVVRGLRPGGYTTHGFRSAFRDWCGDKTNFPRDVVESALAHVISDKTEAAYRRSDALEKRRELMDAWARYCGGQSGAVVQFKKPA